MGSAIGQDDQIFFRAQAHAGLLRAGAKRSGSRSGADPRSRMYDKVRNPEQHQEPLWMVL